MIYRLHGLASLHQFLGDLILFRNLVPLDDRLPSLGELRAVLGLPADVLPRKAELPYGRVVAELLRRARALEAPGTSIQRLIYIGDTRMNDGAAFSNLCAAGNWPGWAFIGRDEPYRPPQAAVEGSFYVANRWSALPEFLAFVTGQGFALDQGTALVIDLDKTAIGARGRNDRVIDEARMEGVHRTVAGLLGPRFDQSAFQEAYDVLNRPDYHRFTADNQDYVAYICLMLGAGVSELDTLLRSIEAGSLQGFAQYIAEVQDCRSELAGTGLEAVHERIWRCMQTGDPTPFKAFRHNEYLATAQRLGHLPDAAAEEVLHRRIAITHEVREAALALRGRGALLFGVSDKPDEASLPTLEQAETGLQPLHLLETMVVGEAT